MLMMLVAHQVSDQHHHTAPLGGGCVAKTKGKSSETIEIRL
jgi:hypothetical protein